MTLWRCSLFFEKLWCNLDVRHNPLFQSLLDLRNIADNWQVHRIPKSRQFSCQIFRSMNLRPYSQEALLCLLTESIFSLLSRKLSRRKAYHQSMSRSRFSTAHARAQKITSAHARAQIFFWTSAQIGAQLKKSRILGLTLLEISCFLHFCIYFRLFNSLLPCLKGH